MRGRTLRNHGGRTAPHPSPRALRLAVDHAEHPAHVRAHLRKIIRDFFKRLHFILLILFREHLPEALRVAYGLCGFANIVVAIASGADAAQSLVAGANAFLPKPIDFNGLLSKVAALLNIEWSDEIRQAEAAGPSEAAAPVADPSIETLIAPPPEEIEALHHLARLGDMKAIAKHATQLPEFDERYRPFADHLSRLAKDYRSKAILSFVERYLIER